MLSQEEIKQYTEWAIESEKEFYSDDDFMPDDETIMNCINEDINLGYEDDKNYNLNKPLNNKILCITGLGLWNGKKSGYKILGNNLNEVLDFISCDEVHIYFDGHNIKAEGYHHDGKNYAEFREIKDNVNIDTLLNKIYSGENISRSLLNYYTKPLGQYVKNIYGW